VIEGVGRRFKEVADSGCVADGRVNACFGETIETSCRYLQIQTFCTFLLKTSASMWLREESLLDLVSRWWTEGRPAFGMAMYSFVKRLQYVKYKLKHWNKY